jgi:DNA polymerase/3'-5' exonuclease PolX
MSTVTRDQVIDILERIALLLELQGENPFKVRAYHNGARALEMLEDDLGTLVREDQLKGIPGIGEAKNIAAQLLAACVLPGVVVHLTETPSTAYLRAGPAPVPKLPEVARRQASHSM